MANSKKPSRVTLMRVGAICFGLVLLLVLEGGLRLAGLGRIADAGDPFVGFSDVLPLFQLNDEGTRFETALFRQDFFQPDWFHAQKPDDEFRVFCFGGSTVQGRPYAIETSFTTWLELSLKAADPERSWRVVNCGGVSYASYRLIPILKETLDYQPDLFIIYTGHNEFLEERSYEEIKNQPKWLKAVHERAVGWRIYGLAKQLVRPTEPTEAEKKSNLPAEVDALLDYQGGLAKYRRNDQWHRGVVEHYEHNLRRMIHLARDHGVPVLLANPISDLRDTAPFKTELGADLNEEQRANFVELWEEAKEASWDDLDAKLEAIQKVIAIDPRYADAQFLLARVRDALGQHEQAKQAYCRAKDEDICTLRMTEPMHEAVCLVASQTGTPLVDVRGLFESKAEFGIPGDDELIDHVHPHIEGHQWIADLLMDHIQALGIVRPEDGWLERREKLYKENFVLLPESYFPFALSRLEGLNNWARGRVDKLDPKDASRDDD